MLVEAAGLRWTLGLIAGAIAVVAVAGVIVVAPRIAPVGEQPLRAEPAR